MSSKRIHFRVDGDLHAQLEAQVERLRAQGVHVSSASTVARHLLHQALGNSMATAALAEVSMLTSALAERAFKQLVHRVILELDPMLEELAREQEIELR